ncbi:MAG TPA: hypothetical protein GXZ90_09860 [Clostridiales bacterium]|nr:hypothetical protein [Clostridiales bacterium]
MNEKQTKTFFNVIRSMSDGEIYEVLYKIYFDGYVDHVNYNGDFDKWLKKYYKENIKC